MSTTHSTAAPCESERRTRLLADITAELLAADEPQRIVESICGRIMEQLQCEVFFNFLVDDREDCLRLNACGGVSPETAAQLATLDFHSTVCGCVARLGRRMVAQHVQSTSDPIADAIRGMGVQAYACHPLIAQGRTIGTLSFGSRERPTFADDDLELMRTVANQAAVAVQRMRLLEASERHARRAEEANAAKSRFLAHMSHELRTPMNAVLGMTDLALREELPPGVRDCLQTARQSAAGLLEVLNDIVDYAQIEAGDVQLQSAPFDVRETLDSLLKTIGAAAAEKGLDFRCDLCDLPTPVLGDALRLRQVLWNLLSNALKFTRQGQVTLRACTASRTAAEAVLRFCVTDTGIGLAQKDQSRVFLPFTQADDFLTRRHGGVGLGLSIAGKLVELMGGRIAMDSRPGEGATVQFTARFGLSTPSGGHDKPPPNASPPRALRLLVAEDTPASRKYADYVLSRRGHRVTLVSDGQQALDAVVRDDFDVVLMDVQMPVLDGLQATRAVRRLADSAKARVPVIAMTAHTRHNDAEGCLAAGMNAYLGKPIEADQLIEVVERLGGEATDAARTAPARCAAHDAPSVAAQPGGPAVFSLEDAVGRCFGQYEMFREMVGYLFAEAEPLLAQLRAALDRGSAAEMALAAHRLDGTVAYLGAAQASEALQCVDDLGRLDEFHPGEARKAVERLEDEVARLMQALSPHRPTAAG